MTRYKKFMDDIELSEDAPIWSKRLIKCLSDIEMSQAELADKSGIPTATLNSWIRGVGEPKVSGLNTVAKTLGVSLDYLMGNIEIKSSDVKNKEINKRLGLSDNAISILEQSVKSNSKDNIQRNHIVEIINFLLSEKENRRTFQNIWLCLFADIKFSPSGNYCVVDVNNENTTYCYNIEKPRAIFFAQLQEGLILMRNKIVKGTMK